MIDGDKRRWLLFFFTAYSGTAPVRPVTMSLIRLPQPPVSGARLCSFLDFNILGRSGLSNGFIFCHIPFMFLIILLGRGIFYYLCDILYLPQCDTVDDYFFIEFWKVALWGFGTDVWKKRSKKFRVQTELYFLISTIKLRPVLVVTEYTTVKSIPLRNSMHPMRIFGFYFTVDYCGIILKRVPPS